MKSVVQDSTCRPDALPAGPARRTGSRVRRSPRRRSGSGPPRAPVDLQVHRPLNRTSRLGAAVCADRCHSDVRCRPAAAPPRLRQPLLPVCQEHGHDAPTSGRRVAQCDHCRTRRAGRPSPRLARPAQRPAAYVGPQRRRSGHPEPAVTSRGHTRPAVASARTCRRRWTNPSAEPRSASSAGRRPAVLLVAVRQAGGRTRSGRVSDLPAASTFTGGQERGC